jgi:dolichyl-phosphate beta-glucosyltransferase
MGTQIGRNTAGIAPAGRCIVVVPCYNEAARLQPVLFSRFLAEDQQVNFLFVNDGSRDATLSVLETLRTKHPDRVHVLDKQPNGGKAEAVRSGMLAAIALEGVAVTGFWDADLATPLDVIPQLLNRLVEDPDLQMIFGSRVRLLGHAIHRKPVRHYLGRIFATAVSTILALPIYDTQCGAKLFRVTPELKSILAAPFQSRWIFDVEIIARFMAIHNKDASFADKAIYENPLPRWEDVAGSKVGPLDFFTAFYELIKIRRTFRRTMQSKSIQTYGRDPKPQTATGGTDRQIGS